MNMDDELEKKLTELGQRLAGPESLVNDVMNRIEQKPIERTGRLKLDWRKIMKTRWTKVAVAAAAAVAVFIVAHYGFAKPAWAEVVEAMAHVRSFNFYEFKFRGGKLTNWGRGWLSDKEARFQKSDGRIWLDDGKAQIILDKNGKVLSENESELSDLLSFGCSMDVLLKTWSLDENEYADQSPVKVADDFLIYNFTPPAKIGSWAERIDVSVGKNSRLPFQVKLLRKDGNSDSYDLYVIDYTTTEMPPLPVPEQLVAPVPKGIKYGTGQCVLGEEVSIEVPDSPGIHSVVIRPYYEFFEGMGELLVADAAFVTWGGYRRSFLRQMPFKKNMYLNGGMGDHYWPDEKSRHFGYHIVFDRIGDKTFALKATAWFDLRFGGEEILPPKDDSWNKE